MTHSEITRLLIEVSDGEGIDARQNERLFELVYEELRRTASGLMLRERGNHTLQPTALVHESYLRIVNQDQAQWANRAHFLGIAARCMRQILVDHARTKNAEKRGGGLKAVTLEEQLLSTGESPIDLIDLDDALTQFASIDPRGAQVAEMRLFGGMTVDEIARSLDVSRRTVDGDWATARMWLRRELGD